MRREVLNGELFHSVLEAKVVIEQWLELYNTRRPHRGLGGKTPAAYAKMARAERDDDDRWWGCDESAYRHQKLDQSRTGRDSDARP